jgi:hypothetical protein
MQHRRCRAARDAFRQSRAVAVDGDSIAFSCGIANFHRAEKIATTPRTELGRTRTARDLPPDDERQAWSQLLEAARRDLFAAKSARSQRMADGERGRVDASCERPKASCDARRGTCLPHRSGESCLG